MEDKKFAFAKFALPGFAVLAFLALIVGLIGALGGPSRASVTDLQTAVTNLQTAVNGLDTSKANASDLANLQTAVTNLQTAVNGLDTSKANASDLAALAKTVSDLQTAMDSLDAASAADLIALANEVNTLGASVATLMATQEPATPAAPTEPTAAPTAEPTAEPNPTAQGQAGWANLPDGRQVWIGPEANASVHIEFVDVDPDSSNAVIGIAGGKAVAAFAVMGGNAQGCEVTVTPLRDALNLSCPVTTVVFAISQDGENVTVTTPGFGGSGYLTFGEVASLLRQTRQSVENPLLVGPNAGFFLAWVSTAPISGLYIP